MCTIIYRESDVIVKNLRCVFNNWNICLGSSEPKGEIGENKCLSIFTLLLREPKDSARSIHFVTQKPTCKGDVFPFIWKKR